MQAPEVGQPAAAGAARRPQDDNGQPASTANPRNSRSKQSERRTLAEAVVVAKFWRNRKGEAVIVQLRAFEGHAIVDARVNFTDSEGHLRPSKKGLSLAVRRLPELAAALAEAERKARELGLLSAEAGS
jgi:Transcriptional Coactivator p15 (PC4)